MNSHLSIRFSSKSVLGVLGAQLVEHFIHSLSCWKGRSIMGSSRAHRLRVLGNHTQDDLRLFLGSGTVICMLLERHGTILSWLSYSTRQQTQETRTELSYGLSWKKVSIGIVIAIAAGARAASLVLVPLSEQRVLTAIEQSE
jgi:hypothetical protein